MVGWKFYLHSVVLIIPVNLICGIARWPCSNFFIYFLPPGHPKCPKVPPLEHAPVDRMKIPFDMFISSDFIWDFGKLPFPTHLGKYIIKIGKIRAKIHEIGKIKAIFGLGMTPIYGLKNGQIKSLISFICENTHKVWYKNHWNWLCNWN